MSSCWFSAKHKTLLTEGIIAIECISCVQYLMYIDLTFTERSLVYCSIFPGPDLMDFMVPIIGYGISGIKTNSSGALIL